MVLVSESAPKEFVDIVSAPPPTVLFAPNRFRWRHTQQDDLPGTTLFQADPDRDKRFYITSNSSNCALQVKSGRGSAQFVLVRGASYTFEGYAATILTEPAYPFADGVIEYASGYSTPGFNLQDSRIWRFNPQSQYPGFPTSILRLSSNNNIRICIDTVPGPTCEVRMTGPFPRAYLGGPGMTPSARDPYCVDVFCSEPEVRMFGIDFTQPPTPPPPPQREMGGRYWTGV